MGTAAPVPPPAPIEYTMRSHPKLGAMLVCRWKAGSGDDETTAHKYVVEYKLKGSSEWVVDTPAGGVEIVPEWDGQHYYILSDANIECGTKITSRVAQISAAGLVSEFAVSNERKLKC